MPFEFDYEFRKELETSLNPYERVCDIASAAREISENNNDRIMHSDAITYAIHNIIPNDEQLLNGIDEYEARYIRDIFCYIDDEHIKNSIYDSFYASKQAHRLIFKYEISNMSKSDKARVRIITRMLWFTLI